MSRYLRRGPYSKACTNCRKAKKGCSGCINKQCQRCIKKGLLCIPYKNNCKKIADKHETCLELSSTTTDFQSSYEDQQIEHSEMPVATQNQEHHSCSFEIMHGNRENKHIADLIRHNGMSNNKSNQPEKRLHSPVSEDNNNALYALHEDHETNYMNYDDISGYMYYGINGYMEYDINELMGLSSIPCDDVQGTYSYENGCYQILNYEYADDSITRFKNQDLYNDSIYVHEPTHENSNEFKIPGTDI
ncbi:16681_t:CDS:2 [Acaulospora morrowiae]|uniref:16681_t:CDS:1 n=1 Tax=Acaulospora morrowiae TaxID=94023 RepID=A0A9N9BTQ1_9GLOM|nr:16681_t:CDS:2 [Acaulospora morrowiae]